MLSRDGKRYAVTSDEGFRVDRTGSPMTQFVLRYIEADHVLEYPLENLAPGSMTPIVVDEIERWQPPFQSELISGSRREQIAERLAAALVFLGDPCKVVRSTE
jgi:hypothetical protein